MIDKDLANKVTSEKLGGIWTQKNSNGTDKWLADIFRGLPNEKQVSYRAMLGVMPSLDTINTNFQHYLLADYFAGDQGYNQELFESAFMQTFYGSVKKCDQPPKLNYYDPVLLQEIVKIQYSLMFTAAIKDWIDFDLLPNHTAIRAKDHIDYGGGDLAGHDRGEGFF